MQWSSDENLSHSLFQLFDEAPEWNYNHRLESLKIIFNHKTAAPSGHLHMRKVKEEMDPQRWSWWRNETCGCIILELSGISKLWVLIFTCHLLMDKNTLKLGIMKKKKKKRYQEWSRTQTIWLTLGAPSANLENLRVGGKITSSLCYGCATVFPAGVFWAMWLTGIWSGSESGLEMVWKEIMTTEMGVISKVSVHLFSCLPPAVSLEVTWWKRHFKATRLTSRHTGGGY